MIMDWQEISSFIIVAAAVALIVRSEIRKYKLRKTRLCGGDCNCAATKFTLLKQHQTKQV
jgi:hypothetical protein